MNTTLIEDDLPSLFNKDYLTFSSGWCWEERPYWGLVVELFGIIPPSVQIDVPHDQKSTEYWFYFAAVSRAISYVATMNGEQDPLPGFAQVCNKLTHELMKESIENGTPVHMLLTEYKLNETHRQPDLSDFYVVEYKAAVNLKKVLMERQWTHKWIEKYVQDQLTEKVVCERCGEREDEIKAFFINAEMGKDEQRLCWSCYEKMTAVESAWPFSEWYMHMQGEQWSVNSKLTEELKERYEAYCKGEGVIPYWGEGVLEKEKDEQDGVA